MSAEITTAPGRYESSAKMCRENGWKVGDWLEGDEGYGPTVIELRYVGEHMIVAKELFHGGQRVRSREHGWTLALRSWRKLMSDERLALEEGARQ